MPSCEQVVQRLEAAGRGNRQQKAVEAAEVVVVVEVAGVEVAGSCEQVVQRLEAAGRGSCQPKAVRATEGVTVVWRWLG